MKCLTRAKPTKALSKNYTSRRRALGLFSFDKWLGVAIGHPGIFNLIQCPGLFDL